MGLGGSGWWGGGVQRADPGAGCRKGVRRTKGQRLRLRRGLSRLSVWASQCDPSAHGPVNKAAVTWTRRESCWEF